MEASAGLVLKLCDEINAEEPEHCYWFRIFKQPSLVELGSGSSRDGLFDSVTRCTDCSSVYYRPRSPLPPFFSFTTTVHTFAPSGGDNEMNRISAKQNAALIRWECNSVFWPLKISITS